MALPLDLYALERAAREWEHTPFRANSESAGRAGGVCCHLLVWRLYIAAGLAVPRPPLGRPARARYSSESIMEAWLDACPCFQRLGPGEPVRPGDLLGYRLGGAVHHTAVMLAGGLIVHAINGPGVVITPAADPTWAGRHAVTYRPINYTLPTLSTP